MSLNLLPQSSEEFSSKVYWDSFFKKRAKSFEWYGEYENLIEILYKYIKKDDRVLVPGCGNSKLSVDLFDRSGFKNITNIDISEVVIKQMCQQYQRTRPDLKYLVGDVTRMEFENDSFSVCLDKGTLDALFTDDSESTVATIKAYFDEVSRVLRKGGRFLCISLLQEHILDYILRYFSESNFLLRIVRCLEAEEKTMEASEDGSFMPIFMIVATKISMPMKIYEVCLTGNDPVRFSDSLQLKDAILSVQKTTMIRNGLVKNFGNKEEVFFDLFRPNEKVPRYTLYILDYAAGKSSHHYGCFICPIGRENEWLFSTKAGRLELLRTSRFKRLAIATMQRGQEYTDLDAVKKELEGAVKSFAPVDFKDAKIPFLSLADDLGSRELVFSGNSEFTGDFVVEDVTIDGKKTYRRLIFLNNKLIIQSEALLKSVKVKNKKEFKVDHGFLGCQHHLYMIAGIQTSIKLNKTSKESDCLLIGLGAGGLSSYITKYLKIKSTVVEIDPAIVEVAKKYYELCEDENLTVLVDDGLRYLKVSDGNQKFKSILFDVDSKDSSLGISCPPPDFLDPEILGAVKRLLTKNGVFILNLVCRDTTLKEQVIECLKKHFPCIASYQLEDEINDILFCHSMKYEIFLETLATAANEFNNFAKKNKQENSINIKQLFETIKVL